MQGNEIIDKILEELHLNTHSFSENIGVLYQRIRDIKGGKTQKISSDVANSIVSAYPQFNISWLLTGEGNMLKNTVTKSNDNTGIPLIPLDAVAGYGEDNSGIAYEDCEKYRIPEFEKSGVEFLIRVSGSSMYPKYSNGDVLACRKIYEIEFFQWGKVYVIDSSQGQMVKRIFEDKENKENIILVSDNKEKYPEFSIPKTSIRSLSIVLGVVRME